MIHNTPVTLIISLFITILYSTSVMDMISCKDKDLLGCLRSNFAHADVYHLVSNLVAFFALSNIEKELGMKKFILLISTIIMFNSVVELSIYKIFPQLPPAIGFSGVIFGLATWELVIKQKVDISLIISMVVMSSVKKSTSLMGHMVGVVVGFMVGLAWKKLSFY